jgi:hypothetical protein
MRSIRTLEDLREAWSLITGSEAPAHGTPVFAEPAHMQELTDVRDQPQQSQLLTEMQVEERAGVQDQLAGAQQKHAEELAGVRQMHAEELAGVCQMHAEELVGLRSQLELALQANCGPSLEVQGETGGTAEVHDPFTIVASVLFHVLVSFFYLRAEQPSFAKQDLCA